MPNRILREGILTSRRVNRLSDKAELFYRRLMSKLDDYGRCEADAELMRSNCYPLRVDKVKAPHIEAWLEECRKAGLLVIYAANGKRYLQYLDWHQQERSNSKFPAPAEQVIADAKQMIADAHLDVFVSVVVSEGDVMSGKPDAPPLNGKAKFQTEALEILTFLNDKASRHYEPVPANLELIVGRLRDGASVADLRAVVAKKCREWVGDEKMSAYLRPATLFNRTKFAQYQGELHREV